MGRSVCLDLSSDLGGTSLNLRPHSSFRLLKVSEDLRAFVGVLYLSTWTVLNNETEKNLNYNIHEIAPQACQTRGPALTMLPWEKPACLLEDKRGDMWYPSRLGAGFDFLDSLKGCLGHTGESLV